MSKQDDAIKIFPQVIEMIESDLMEVEHYLKKAIKVAIVGGMQAESKIATEIYVEVQKLNEVIKILTT